MIIPCEVAVKTVIPAVKALIAQEMVENRNLKQGTVASVLGMSQSAISKYANGVRGRTISMEDNWQIRPLIASMVDLLMKNDSQRDEFLQVFCQTCRTIRNTRVMCGFCRKSDPKTKISDCGFCT